MEEKMREHAGQMYELICSSLDKQKFRYVKNEAKRQVIFALKDENVSISVGIAVEEQKQRIHLCSPWDIPLSANKLKENAIAVCAVNSAMADGCLVHNIPNNKIEYKISVSLWDSKAGEGIIDYLLGSAYTVAARYSEMFDKLNKGAMGMDEFTALC